MQKPFSVTQVETGDEVLLTISGAISERCTLPALSRPSLKKIVIDFADVTYFNSIGIQRWIKWLRETSRQLPEVFFELQRLPPVAVMNMGFVREFLPSKTSIKSIYIIFNCNTCDFELQEFVQAQTAETYKESLKLERKCKNCGTPMKADANLERFFWF